MSTLTASELKRVEAGLPLLSEWSDVILVPFVVKKLAHPAVLWLNEGWFAQRGLDVRDESVRVRVRSWIAEQFAYVVSDSTNATDVHDSESKVFYADRYGGSGLVEHGGSGRAGITGRFQVKGIGATPLVGQVQDWGYSHGCMWLEEAIRETICAEVAAAEFPYAAVRAIAIVDTGINYEGNDGCFYERRALLIRPALPRPAYLQRAVLFKRKDPSELDHLIDVKRVSDAIAFFEETATEEGVVNSRASRSLPKLVEHISDQIAFGLAHRLHLTGYFSSNLTMDGGLLDFGSFTSAPDWLAAFISDRVARGLSETANLRAIIKSLVFYINKYSKSKCTLSDVEVARAAEARIRSQFAHECISIWNLPDTVVDTTELLKLTVEYLMASNRRFFDKATQRTMLIWRDDQFEGPVLSGFNCTPAERSALRRLELEVEKICRDLPSPSGQLALSLSTAKRILTPRRLLSRELLQQRIYEAIGGQFARVGADPRSIDMLFRDVLSASRRCWNWLPRNLVVLAQRVDPLASYVVCADAFSRRTFLCLEATHSDLYINAFSGEVPLGLIDDFKLYCDSGRWRGMLPIRSDESGDFCIDATSLAGTKVPQMVYSFKCSISWIASNLQAIE